MFEPERTVEKITIDVNGLNVSEYSSLDDFIREAPKVLKHHLLKDNMKSLTATVFYRGRKWKESRDLLDFLVRTFDSGIGIRFVDGSSDEGIDYHVSLTLRGNGISVPGSFRVERSTFVSRMNDTVLHLNLSSPVNVQSVAEIFNPLVLQIRLKNVPVVDCKLEIFLDEDETEILDYHDSMIKTVFEDQIYRANRRFIPWTFGVVHRLSPIGKKETPTGNDGR